MSATISLAADGRLRLVLTGPSGKEHTVLLPTTPPGLAALVRLLRDHAATPKAKLGAPGALTQAQIDAMLAAFKPRAPVVDVELDEIGLL